MSALVFIFSGGTGGHIYPALATGLKLVENGHKVRWFGKKQSLESNVCATNKIDFCGLKLQGYNGKSIVQKLIAAILFVVASIEVLLQCWQQKPNVLVCYGGYTTIPALLASYIMRIPLVVHEQNTLISNANQLASKFSERLYIGMPSPDTRWQLIGNPLRSSLRGADRKRLDLQPTIKKIAVLGGSQGATAINLAVNQCLQKSDAATYHWRIFTGVDKLQDIDALFHTADNVQVAEYCSDMHTLYQWADIIICRAGAMTIAEIGVYGLPSILIPLPGSINNHQSHNAQKIESLGAGMMLEQNAVLGSNLQFTINELFANPLQYRQMSRIGFNFSKPNATSDLVEVILDCAGFHTETLMNGSSK